MLEIIKMEVQDQSRFLALGDVDSRTLAPGPWLAYHQCAAGDANARQRQASDLVGAGSFRT